MLTRRVLLTASLGALATASARAGEGGPAPPYELHDIEVDGDRRLGKRFTLLVPRHTRARVPLLVLLHGLGETGDQRTGAHAWVERYGLGQAYERLRTAPIRALHADLRHWSAARLAEVNALIAAQPFRGLAIACPYTPDVYQARSREATLDGYADWLVDVVIARARSEAPIVADAAHTFLDGCSLGGYVGIEVFLRKAQYFGAWGSVQGAFGAHRTTDYARRIAAVIERHGPRPLHLETSTADPFRAVNAELARALGKLGVAAELAILPGPHNQPFLRDSGTLEMLLWHDRLPR